MQAPAHSQLRFEETIYGISGVLTWTATEKGSTASGQALCIPRKADHRLDNNTAQDATVPCLATPAAIGPQFFRECADVINTAGSGLPDRAKMAEIMHRFGLTPAAPSG